MDLFSPFVDIRPLAVAQTPELREYRMCYLDGDAVEGLGFRGQGLVRKEEPLADP